MSNYKSQTAIANSLDYDTALTVEYDQDQTNGTILTPTSGTKLAIKGTYVTTEATSGFVRILIDGDTVATYYANQSPAYLPITKKGLRNSALKVTSNLGADKNYFILVNYREE
jgi:hypothetical protein